MSEIYPGNYFITLSLSFRFRSKAFPFTKIIDYQASYSYLLRPLPPLLLELPPPELPELPPPLKLPPEFPLLLEDGV
jgi:hypothetical protein